MEKPKFDYGVTVQLMTGIGSYKKGAIAAICGIFRANTQHLVEKYHTCKNSVVYTIEFGTGESIEVTESQISVADE